MSIQPSEFSKISLIIGLAWLMNYFKEKGKLNKPLSLLVILAVIAIPVLLIVKQPDYGTAMVMLAIVAFMLFAAGVDYKYIIGAIIICAVALPLAYNYVLPEHAKSRIMVFLNPQIDPQGAGYNIIQAELAVGSGQLFGMGLLEGNQTQLRILTDESNGFYFRGNQRRNGIYRFSFGHCFICTFDNKRV